MYERLRWTFKLYDINGDGCISRGELAEIVLAVHELMGRRAHQVEDDRKARDQIDRVFRKLDLNQDGVITIEEFMESCLKDDVITRSLQMFDAVLWTELTTSTKSAVTKVTNNDPLEPIPSTSFSSPDPKNTDRL